MLHFRLCYTFSLLALLLFILRAVLISFYLWSVELCLGLPSTFSLLRQLDLGNLAWFFPHFGGLIQGLTFALYFLFKLWWNFCHVPFSYSFVSMNLQPLTSLFIVFRITRFLSLFAFINRIFSWLWLFLVSVL
jgi:hypothetical protein